MNTAPPALADGPLLVTANDVATAAHRLAGHAHRTPVMTSRTLDERLGGAHIHLKCENFQRSGAFKFRGAYNALSQLDADARKRGVLTWSSGNHAQATALAGRLLGVPVAIVMPDNAPAVKLAATRGYGGEVLLYAPAETVREEFGRKVAAERGLTIIPPYDHPHIVAGQGTVAHELIEQVGPLDVLLTPCGGGGLLSGCALAAKAANPACKVIGVEPLAGDDATRSFHSRTLQTVHNPDTIADGARTPSLGAVTFPLICKWVDDMVTVTDAQIIPAMAFLWERLKLVVEPTGAMTSAALLSSIVKVDAGARVGVVISGGNVDLRQAAQWFS
ncbi:MAG: threo-3-hydroxy-L-aspartate ammonia-lyase [Planctomycetota bacterium]